MDDRQDLVRVFEDKGKPVDLVDRVYDNPHARVCKDYKPFVNKAGIVYCESAMHGNGITVGSVNDMSDSFCPSCECAVSHHYNNRCLGCGAEGCRC